MTQFVYLLWEDLAIKGDSPAFEAVFTSPEKAWSYVNRHFPDLSPEEAEAEFYVEEEILDPKES